MALLQQPGQGLLRCSLALGTMTDPRTVETIQHALNGMTRLLLSCHGGVDRLGQHARLPAQPVRHRYRVRGVLSVDLPDLLHSPQTSFSPSLSPVKVCDGVHEECEVSYCACLYRLHWDAQLGGYTIDAHPVSSTRSSTIILTTKMKLQRAKAHACKLPRPNLACVVGDPACYQEILMVHPQQKHQAISTPASCSGSQGQPGAHTSHRARPETLGMPQTPQKCLRMWLWDAGRWRRAA